PPVPGRPRERRWRSRRRAPRDRTATDRPAGGPRGRWVRRPKGAAWRAARMPAPRAMVQFVPRHGGPRRHGEPSLPPVGGTSPSRSLRFPLSFSASFAMARGWSWARRWGGHGYGHGGPEPSGSGGPAGFEAWHRSSTSVGRPTIPVPPANRPACSADAGSRDG